MSKEENAIAIWLFIIEELKDKIKALESTVEVLRRYINKID